nr:hypothetical protein [uncultured bacterium]
MPQFRGTKTMSDQPIDNLMNAIAQQLAGDVAELVLAKVRLEMSNQAKATTPICYDEQEASQVLKCSPQTMARLRKSGLIGHVLLPSGRPGYTPAILTDYLGRHEVQAGSKPAGVYEFQARSAAK